MLCLLRVRWQSPVDAVSVTTLACDARVVTREVGVLSRRQNELLSVYRAVCEERQRLVAELQSAERLRVSVRPGKRVGEGGKRAALVLVLVLVLVVADDQAQ